MLLAQKIAALDMGKLVADVAPFLEYPEERNLFEAETIRSALR
jgi:hypothetical protein